VKSSKVDNNNIDLANLVDAVQGAINSMGDKEGCSYKCKNGKLLSLFVFFL
jgi:hypothetical protein